MYNAMVTCHFIFDWWCQPRDIAVNKATSLPHMLKHLAILHVAFSVLAFFYGVSQWAVVINTIAHGAQDKLIWGCYGNLREEHPYDGDKYDDFWFWFCIALDQMCHLNLMFYLFGA